MRFLRHQSAADDAKAVSSESGSESDGGTEDALNPRGFTPAKGRPTPKRRDAEGKRRGPAPPPPKTQRESMKLAKQNRASRAERRKENMARRGRIASGETLLPRDRGPVKAFVRDLVDSRRHVIGLFMPLAGLVFVSLIVPVPQVQQMFSLFCMAMMAAMILEGILLGRRITNQARERFPKEQISGLSLGWYAFARASQIRKLRTPKVRVKVGDKV
ncbi:DUF3043 domain-containing protein [Pseudonocardia spinosispora]|uniref:DUF3043 domain-containing protein n=1 Tax=Pseudonocardia spinosispora TaxID=103441 RepID=UPI0004918DAD|nr:DUF3043 domain-containing protein [Pseudonocardia spinosispora]